MRHQRLRRTRGGGLAGVLAPLFAVAALGCAGAASHTSEPDLAGVVVVPERWMSPYDRASDLDSPAYWSGQGRSWVIATAKATDDLWLFHAPSGRLVRRIGRGGDDPGEFDRPNGIAVIGDLLLVVERDNARVQVLSLPEFTPLGSFGQSELVFPYGIAFRPNDDGSIDVFVTDDYGNEADLAEGTEPRGDFTRRVKHYRLHVDPAAPEGSRVDARLVRAFGEAEGPGALRIVETIQLDAAQDLLLVTDEFGYEQEAYSLDGRYLGRTIAADVYRHGDPEGVMLYRCGASDGYWILTDQGDTRSVFHVLERSTFEHLGSFAGEATANTDGIWLTQERVENLGAGALFAVHDDGGLAAFAWSDIAAALGLRGDCGP